jgi:hypothetical protein
MGERLLVVAPVYTEARYLDLGADALERQTRRPDLWVIVDDGSTDETAAIAAAISERLDFVRVFSSSDLLAGRVKDRLATAAAPRTFNLGVNSVEWEGFTHIAKLDGDTELPEDYFERLLAEFRADPSLGLAGGVYADPDPDPESNGWKVIPIPVDHHVPGTLKCYSIDCYRAIGGVQERLGWDTIDETYARMRGFRTRAFGELVAHHHRPWGSADGTLRGRARHGQCAYIVHFSLPWVTLRSFKIARARPRGLSGVAFLYGYLASPFQGVAQVDDPEFKRFVRRELRERARDELRGRATRLRPLVSASSSPRS